MIISHKFKFIFICNGKTGTTSIENALKTFDESRDMNNGARGLWVNKHIPPVVVKSFLPAEIWNEYFKFVFVRHPLDWFVSQYRYNFGTPNFPLKPIIRRPWKANKLIKQYQKKKAMSYQEILDKNEVNLVFRRLKSFRGLPYTETLMQSSYVYDVDGNIIVDFIGKFENLAQDMENIKAKIGIDFELPYLNKTIRRPYQDCLTKEAIEEIKKLWELDFINFGYEINI